MSPAIPIPLFYTITPPTTQDGEKKSVFLKHQDLGSYLASLYTQQGEGVVRLPAPVGRAAGIEEQKATFVLQKGDVRVPEDDYASFGEATRQTPAAALLTARVVDHCNPNTTEAELQRLREAQVRRVHVTLDGADGGVECQPLKERRFDQVPRVQDQICRFEVREQSLRQALRTPGYVRVGEDDG